MPTATTAELIQFLIHEADRGMAPATRKAQTVTLRRFYAWAVMTGHSTADPTVHLPAPRVSPGEAPTYTPEEARTILDHTGSLTHTWGRIRHAVIATLRYTGVRSAELRSMRLDRLDLERGEVRVHSKGDRHRVVVVPDPLRVILQAYLDEVRPLLPDSPLLFVSPSPLSAQPDHQLGSEAVHLQAELAGRDAGVAGRHFPHRWRHTYATELVRAGVPLAVVQRLLGHVSIHATVLYTHLSVEDVRSATRHLT